LAILLTLTIMSVIIHPTARTWSDLQNTSESSQASYPANPATLGAIPDGPATCDGYGPARDVTFTVNGVSGTINNVEVEFTLNPQHDWVGDLDVRLISPGGALQHVIFSRTGATVPTQVGSLNDAAGPYVFKDAAPVSPTWWSAAGAVNTPIPSGMYRTSSAGEVAGGGVNTLMTPVFAGMGAAANGTWTLRFRDHCSAEVGTVSAATLTINTVPTAVTHHVVDFDGDGTTDSTVVRNTAGGPNGQITWFVNNSQTGTFSSQDWGIFSDFFVPQDYDGDGKTDFAVWRSGPPSNSYFYILQSSTVTLRADQFGQSGDDPTVVGDYDGDGKSDPAVFRAGASAGDQSFWFYRASSGPMSGQVIANQWGQNGDFPAPGDYDGDGKADFVVQRNGGGGQAVFYLNQSTSGFASLSYGNPTDVIVPGDYDGDGKTDIATVRGSGGAILWFIRRSSDGVINSFNFGVSATDFTTQGDWDGDGKIDLAVWRPNADPTQTFFYWLRSSDGALGALRWGQNSDYPVANYNSH
jgi:subtilisin-like proprotein convertase family protein